MDQRNILPIFYFENQTKNKVYQNTLMDIE